QGTEERSGRSAGGSGGAHRREAYSEGGRGAGHGGSRQGNDRPHHWRLSARRIGFPGVDGPARHRDTPRTADLGRSIRRGRDMGSAVLPGQLRRILQHATLVVNTPAGSSPSPTG